MICGQVNGLLSDPKLKGDRNVLVRFGLADRIIRHYLGNNIANTAFFPQHTQYKKKYKKAREYTKVSSSEKKDKLHYQERWIRFAECILNLQQIEGFNILLNDIKAGNFDSRFHELEAASFLHRRDIPISFVKPQSVKGSDYDILISEPEIHVEIKGKQESTKLSNKTIINSLNKARKQILSSKPGVIFIKIPQSWVSEKDSESIISTSVSYFFKNTERILAVIIIWVEIQTDSGMYRPIYKFRSYINKKSSQYALNEHCIEKINSDLKQGLNLNNIIHLSLLITKIHGKNPKNEHILEILNSPANIIPKF